MEGGILGEKCCCVAIVEFNGFLSLFPGVESGLFAFMFNLLILKVGKGVMWWRMEGCA